MTIVFRLAVVLATVVGFALFGRAGEPPAPTVHYKHVGDIEGQIVKTPASDEGGTITLQINKLTYGKGSGRRPTPKLKTEKVEFTLTPDAHVRWHKLPKVFDADGKPRARTQAEWRELHSGPPGLPGYPAKFSDLSADQIVVLYLVRPKDTSATPKKKRGEAPEAESTPLVSRIIIMNDRPPAKKSPEKKK